VRSVRSTMEFQVELAMPVSRLDQLDACSVTHANAPVRERASMVSVVLKIGKEILDRGAHADRRNFSVVIARRTDTTQLY
jgi:hypothetical protein